MHVKQILIMKDSISKREYRRMAIIFSKIRMNGTTFIEEDTKDRKMHKGFM